jgi:hypothetical protein
MYAHHLHLDGHNATSVDVFHILQVCAFESKHFPFIKNKYWQYHHFLSKSTVF